MTFIADNNRTAFCLNGLEIDLDELEAFEKQIQVKRALTVNSSNATATSSTTIQPDVDDLDEYLEKLKLKEEQTAEEQQPTTIVSPSSSTSNTSVVVNSGRPMNVAFLIYWFLAILNLANAVYNDDLEEDEDEWDEENAEDDDDDDYSDDDEANESSAAAGAVAAATANKAENKKEEANNASVIVCDGGEFRILMHSCFLESFITELNLDNCRSTSIVGLTDEYTALESLSLINVGLTTLKGFPKLPNLRKLELSDNRISNGLNYLHTSPKLQYINLSGNKIKDLEALKPLKEFKQLTVLDLFNNEATQSDNYREKIFEMIPSLKFLDGFDIHDVEATSEGDDDEENGNYSEDDGKYIQFYINLRE
uniref:U2A'/phosphoprotein 32 family A C-terminal domain-containing protein n=1 Tax=Glossina brevipalpis TaxID=37001 RepID=A0A1A9WNZ6_9MUSC